MKVKEESKKVGLKLNIQKMKIMASNPTSWEIDGETVETVSDFIFLGFPGGSSGKESACNEGDIGSISWLGRFPVEGKSYPLQYSGLEKSMDSVVHRVAKSQTHLSLSQFGTSPLFQVLF